MDINCEISSISEKIFSGKINTLVATGLEGELGIKAGHTPLLTQIKPGSIKIIDSNNKEIIFYISGGFLEVKPDNIIVLADNILRTEQLDEKAIVEARSQAQQKLENNTDMDENNAAIVAQIAQLSAQLRTLRYVQKK